MEENQGNSLTKRSHQSTVNQISTDSQEDAVQNGSYLPLSQAKQLVKVGKLNEAETVLKEGVAHYPANEEMYQQLYDLYKKRNEWRSAKQIARKLVELNPQKATFYFQLGRAFAFLKETSSAKESYISGLQKRHDLSFAHISAQVTHEFPHAFETWTSEYMYVKGKNNYGALFHTADDKQYVTKIAKYNHNAKREALFYKEVCAQFPMLKDMAPTFINAKKMNRILYLTTEWIEGEESTVSDPEEIIEMSEKIASVPASKMLYAYGLPEYVWNYRNSPTFIIQFFTDIHHKVTNERLFAELYKLMEEKEYPQPVKEVIQRLEKQMMPDYLYAYIDPEDHYSLIHGDFHPGNFKRSSKDGTLYIFDWATFTIGPHFLDIARYVSKSLFTFQEVREIYFDCEETGGSLSIIEKIFFLYALILLYILRLREKAVAAYLESCIIPALEELERLVEQFTKESHEAWLLRLRDKKNELTQENLSLADTSVSLKKQNKQIIKRMQLLKKQNQQMKTSKSWKMTAPLRKLLAKWRK